MTEDENETMVNNQANQLKQEELEERDNDKNEDDYITLENNP